MKDVIARLQRELPDTDKDRYDVAYERGRAQARSALLGGGLAIGSALGAGLMWLFDPERGSGRRAQLASRVEGFRNRAAQTASGTATDVGNRVQGFAIERGIKQPPAGSEQGTNGSGPERPLEPTGPEPLSQPGSYAESTVARADVAPPTADEGRGDLGQGYREGFGATAADPAAPGSRVPDPITPDEIAEHGASGPVAGAGQEERVSVVSPETEEQEAATSR